MTTVAEFLRAKAAPIASLPTSPSRGKVYTMRELGETNGQLREWAYNALDCTGTRKVWDAISPRLNANQARTYAFHRALQAPCLAMMRRGVRVDQKALADVMAGLKRELKRISKELNALPVVMEKWDVLEKVTGLCPSPPLGKHHKWPRGEADTPERKCTRCGQARMVRAPFNPNSHDQCARLFHVILGWPREENKNGEESVDDEVLERLIGKYPDFVNLLEPIREARGIRKQIGFLSSRQTPDGRMPSSFNPAAAWTSRFSSSKSPNGLGTNLQNVTESLRYIFVPDPGWELFYADLERAESLVVAFVAGDEGYIAAHNGDTHTLVASYLWPELPWVGEPKADKALAETLPPWDQAPGHNWRFQAKRIQHGSNFGLQPPGIARIAHIPVKVAAAAQGRYFDAFPGIPRWQKWVRELVNEQAPIINPFGFEVSLFGRPWDGHTWRQGLSLVPQSTVAHVLNLGLWRIWRDLDIPGAETEVQVMAQIHDAVFGQWRKEQRAVAARLVKERMVMPFPVKGVDGKVRTCTISVEIMAGGNGSKKNTKPEKGRLNPNGLEVLHV